MSNISSDVASIDKRLPNFFILGATKAGTTSLYEYLSKHPKIYLSQVKEPQFFCHDLLFNKGLDYYCDSFFSQSEGYPLRGEATPHYIYYEKAARRIHENLRCNDLKFIVILRDPVQRAYSLYLNMLHEGVETLSFADALAAEAERTRDKSLEDCCAISYQYVESGLYAKQIRRYLKYFKREQFLFIFFDDLKNDPINVLRNACLFLGVEPSLVNIETRVFNAAGTPRLRMLQRFIREPNIWRRRVGKLLPFELKYRIVTTLLRWNKRPLKYPPLPGSLNAKLRQEFESDIQDLQGITGADLSHWLPG